MGAALAKVQNLEGSDAGWSAEKLHRVRSTSQAQREALAWRVVPSEGVLVAGEDSVRRSPGAPTTLQRVMAQYGTYAQSFWDPALYMAVIANESRGFAQCERFEERLGDWSFGLGQFLTSTAYDLLQKTNFTPPDVPIPKGGDPAKWRTYLCKDNYCLPLIRTYLSILNRQFDLRSDPILVYAAYNAGSPRPNKDSPWGLVHNGPALDNISKWYGDAWFVLNAKKVG